MNIELDAVYNARNELDIKAIYNHESDRIFGIGFFRTGTQSLNAALRLLGMDAVQAPTIFELATHQCVTDTLPIFFWKELITAYPKAKFILTMRDIDSWRRSVLRVIGRNPVWQHNLNWMRDIGFHLYTKKFLGNAGYCEKWDEHFLIHNRDVQEYFLEYCPERLLVINICNGEGWEKLCPFLNKQIPVESFPHIS